MNRASAERYRIVTFAEGKRIPFLRPLIVLIRNAVISPKKAAPPKGLPIAIIICNILSASLHTTPMFSGLIRITIPCPITKKADSAQNRMMITATTVIIESSTNNMYIKYK